MPEENPTPPPVVIVVPGDVQAEGGGFKVTLPGDVKIEHGVIKITDKEGDKT